MKKWIFMVLGFSLLSAGGVTGKEKAPLEMKIKKAVDSFQIVLGKEVVAEFQVPNLKNGAKPEVVLSKPENGWQRVSMTWQVEAPVAQSELSVKMQLLHDPDFWWAPHLTPKEGSCIAQHVFRSPALIAAAGAKTLVLVPDLELCGQNKEQPWFMDLDAQQETFWIGLGKTHTYEHVLYEKVPGMVLEPGTVRLGFFVKVYMDDSEPTNPWSEVSAFLWDRYAVPLYEQGEPGTVPMDHYVRYTYDWAFKNWKDAVWQEFEIDGKRVGAPAFIVNYTQSPNYEEEINMRESLSIWNQAWFSSLRSASGVMRYALRTEDMALQEKARMTKDLALSAPLRNGLFPAVYGTEMEQVTIDGKAYNRSKGWDTGRWSNSNRCPHDKGITPEWYHILDSSWTSLLMLRWHTDIEPDEALLQYARIYADKLLQLQDGRGFFPAWINPESFEPSPVLRESPETSMSVTFLLKLFQITGEEVYRNAALKAMDAVLAEIVPAGRWEDFETYWSCCPWGRDEFLGKKIPRNDMHKQCSFSMFWTAEALLETYRTTNERSYLDWGRRTLDELSMVQQVWQPPFIYVPALGGFGVMNSDAEWNDSRQSLFAELFMEYYKETGNPQLFQRGITAMKSSFVMMYCPDNPVAKVQWEKVYPYFGPEDYGFTMENYAHGGATSSEGVGIGPFTIYDWGNGAASECRNRVYDHFGDVYIDRIQGHAFGIDSIDVKLNEGSYELTDLAPKQQARLIKVVLEDGSSQRVNLQGRKTYPLKGLAD